MSARSRQTPAKGLKQYERAKRVWKSGLPDDPPFLVASQADPHDLKHPRLVSVRPRSLMTEMERSEVEDDVVAAFLITSTLAECHVTGEVKRRPDGRLGFARLSVEPNTECWDSAEVTARTMKAVSPRQVMGLVAEKLRTRPEQVRTLRQAVDDGELGGDVYVELGLDDVDMDALVREAAMADEVPRPGRPRRPDAFYRRVAVEYLQCAPDGHVYETISEHHRDEHDEPAPVDTVRTWVKEAERRGYLTPGERGKAVRQGTRKLDRELDSLGLLPDHRQRRQARKRQTKGTR